MVPSILLAGAGMIVLPWLVETRRRLQNDYWEGQLLFAFLALCIALAGIPFVVLRLYRRIRIVSVTGWNVTAAGYLAMTVFMVQSHFPPFPKLICTVLGVVCLRWAIQGLRLDGMLRRQNLVAPGRREDTD